MNTAAVVSLSVLLSVGAAVGVTYALPPASPPPAPPSVGIDEFRAAIARLEAAQQQLQQSVQTARSNAAAPAERTAVPTIGEPEIAAALQRYLATHGMPSEAGAATAKETPKLDVAAEFAALKQKKTASYWMNQEAWRRLLDAGKMEEAIAMFEQNAKANPNDVTAQMQLADAYLAWVQMDQSKGPQLGMKSDRALDKVLELDENHWQARFTKAVSYSFWPDFLGKKKEAMAQYDRLVRQQETMPISPEQAQTYLFYGNMLDQSGQTAKAREVWQKGLARHPDSAELRQRLSQGQ